MKRHPTEIKSKIRKIPS